MKKIVIILSLISALMFSCADENELLVNPPPRFETVNVRFLNFSGDGQPRTMVMENQTEILNIEDGKASKFFRPPADSVYIEIRKNTISEFRTQARVRFGRNINYTYVALPSALGNPEQNAVDTIISFGTSLSISQNPNESFLKMLNANPDSTVTYSLALGCPNGLRLASNLDYRRVSPTAVVRSGDVPLSVIKMRGSEDSLVGLYSFNFAQRGQYTIIIRPNNFGGEDVFLLDELNSSDNVITKPEEIVNRTATLRTINLSSVPIEIDKIPGETITDGLVPFYIEQDKQISACTSIEKDTLAILSNGNLSSQLVASFGVLEKYSVVVFDSANSKASKSILIEPVRLNETLGNRAIIRVINADYTQIGISVSIGAREITDAKGEDVVRGFRAGDALASRMEFATLSGVTLIEPGTLPVAVFTSTEPAKLISASLFDVQAEKSYLLVIYPDLHNRQKVALIEENDASKPITPLNPGVFTQVIHTTAGKNFISISYPKLFSNAKLNYAGSFATVLPEGQSVITIDGINHTISATSNDRIMLFSGGTIDEQEIFDITEPPIYGAHNHYVRRYINASKEVPDINVNLKENFLLMSNVLYKTRSNFERIYQEKKFSLNFYNALTNKHLLRVDDLFLTYDKTFSIIFTGHSRYGGYSVIIQQEY